MRTLAVISVFGLLISGPVAAQPKPESTPPTITGVDTSAVSFTRFVVENTTGFPMTVTLEAPIGTVVVASADVEPNAKAQFDPMAKNAASARIVANFGKDHGGSFSQDVKLGADGGADYIKTLSASASVGEVKVVEIESSGGKQAKESARP